MKRRGYYTIEVAGEKITGHFSVNFWALLEEELGLKSLGETFDFMSRGVGMSQLRQVVFCSTRAYDLEEDKPFQFSNVFKCGIALEDFGQEDLLKVMEAFTESKLLGNDVNFGIERGNSEKGESEGK